MVSDLLSLPPYSGYAYAYPHKTAYRPLPAPISVREAWAAEKRDALFLYFHLPFCARRCSYCNLFSLAGGGDTARADAYLAALARQAQAVRAQVPPFRVARLAIGGGTPLLLPEPVLERLFGLAADLGGDPGQVACSVETSADACTAAKLHLLRERGVRRVSIGVQSFQSGELQLLGRPADPGSLQLQVGMARETAFPLLNLDLIYGIPGQTTDSWLTSLRVALRYDPEELYLYPLYVRPGTPLAPLAVKQPGSDTRAEAYRAARDLLLGSGYRQLSMRHFVAARVSEPDDDPPYVCQRDGMLGLGSGARSYTRGLHYASPYACAPDAIARLVESYSAQNEADFGMIRHGFVMTAEEQHRRYAIKSLLRCAGLRLAEFRQEFGVDLLAALPELQQLLDSGLAEQTPERFRLTATGLERSDALGPWLYSPQVRQLMEEFSDGS